MRRLRLPGVTFWAAETVATPGDATEIAEGLAVHVSAATIVRKSARQTAVHGARRLRRGESDDIVPRHGKLIQQGRVGRIEFAIRADADGFGVAALDGVDSYLALDLANENGGYGWCPVATHPAYCDDHQQPHGP